MVRCEFDAHSRLARQGVRALGQCPGHRRAGGVGVGVQPHNRGAGVKRLGGAGQPVEHQVWPQFHEGGVLAAERLTLRGVGDDDRADAGRAAVDGAPLACGREVPAAAAGQLVLGQPVDQLHPRLAADVRARAESIQVRAKRLGRQPGHGFGVRAEEVDRLTEQRFPPGRLDQVQSCGHRVSSATRSRGVRAA